MPKGPNKENRPADVIGAAVMVAKIATGEVSESKKPPRNAQPFLFYQRAENYKQSFLCQHVLSDLSRQGNLFVCFTMLFLIKSLGSMTGLYLMSQKQSSLAQIYPLLLNYPSLFFWSRLI